MELTKKQYNLISKCATYANGAYSMETLGCFIENKETDAQAFVCFDNGDLIITGQGTTTFKDWTYNFQIQRTRVSYLNNTLVHTGFVKQYNSVRERIHQEIRNNIEAQDVQVKRILCTGHSLFGAISTIIALDCCLQYDLPVHCVTFGSPRVGSKEFTKLFNNSVDSSYRCVYKKDPVTFVPIPLRFCHVRGGIQLAKFKSLSIHNWCGCQISDHSMQAYEGVLQ
jgi:triacylglycerol lipase